MATDQKYIVDESVIGVTSIFSNTHDHAVLDHVADADEEVLVALGYKQEFKRFAKLIVPKRYNKAESVQFEQGFLHMVLIFCILLGPRPSSINRLDSGLQSSFLRTCGLGLGMGCCRYPHSIRCSGDGGTLLEYANRWRTILRQCCPGARWLGSPGVLGMSPPGSISFGSCFLTLERE